MFQTILFIFVQLPAYNLWADRHCETWVVVRQKYLCEVFCEFGLKHLLLFHMRVFMCVCVCVCVCVCMYVCMYVRMYVERLQAFPEFNLLFIYS